MRVLFVKSHLKLWYVIRYIASRILLTPTASYVNIECMRYVIVFSALLAIETFWFLVMRKRNRFMSVVRTNAALRRHMDEQTGPRR